MRKMKRSTFFNRCKDVRIKSKDTLTFYLHPEYDNGRIVFDERMHFNDMGYFIDTIEEWLKEKNIKYSVENFYWSPVNAASCYMKKLIVSNDNFYWE